LLFCSAFKSTSIALPKEKLLGFWHGGKTLNVCIRVDRVTGLIAVVAFGLGRRSFGWCHFENYLAQDFEN